MSTHSKLHAERLSRHAKAIGPIEGYSAGGAIAKIGAGLMGALFAPPIIEGSRWVGRVSEDERRQKREAKSQGWDEKGFIPEEEK